MPVNVPGVVSFLTGIGLVSYRMHNMFIYVAFKIIPHHLIS